MVTLQRYRSKHLFAESILASKSIHVLDYLVKHFIHNKQYVTSIKTGDIKEFIVCQLLYLKLFYNVNNNTQKGICLFCIFLNKYSFNVRFLGQQNIQKDLFKF